MKKRGDISLWFLIELVGAFLVGWMAVDISMSYAQGTIFEKLNVAKDLAMQINAIAGVNGDAYIINKNLDRYYLYFFDNRIEVSEGEFDQAKGVYYFVNAKNSRFDLKLPKPKQAVISKSGDDIKLSEQAPNSN